MDHTGALGDGADMAFYALQGKGIGAFLGIGIGGHDAFAGVRTALNAELRSQHRQAGCDGVDGKGLADDACGGDDHVLFRDAQRLSGKRAGFFCDLYAVGVAGIGIAAVADDGLGLAIGHMLAGDGDGGAEYFILRIGAGNGAFGLAVNERQILFAAVFTDAAVYACGLEPFGGAHAAFDGDKIHKKLPRFLKMRVGPG